MPAKYGDLSKKGDDLFKKGFEHEHYKLEIASKSDGFEFTTKGALKAGNISSSHECKVACPFTGGKLKTTFAPGKDAFDCEFEYSKVAKVTACFTVPMNGIPMPNVNKVKVNWSNDKAHVNLDSNLGNKVNLDAVVALPQGSLGAKLGLDAKLCALTSKELAFHMTKGNLNCTVKSSLNNDFNAVVHNQIDAKLALATSCTYNASGTSLAIAGQQKACCGTTNNFKVANNGRFSISHVTPFLNSAKLTVSADLDATNLGSGSHKVGAGLKFDF